MDSNSVGLRYALESTIGVLPGSPVWKPLEPNSYEDFGADFKSVARSPITASRQRRKGALTDVEAMGGFEHDWVQDAMYDLMPTFMFAAWRAKKNFAPSSVTGTNTYNVTGNTGTGAVQAGDLVFAEGFTNAGNNGLKTVTSATGTTIVVSGLTNETPPSTAKLTKVGVQGGTGDITLTVSGGVATFGSTTFDFTTLGMIPGEWFFVGGDSAGTKFATAANNGWYRAQTISANAIVCDRVPGSVVTDNGSGKTIRIFIGHVIKNESDPANIVRSTVQLEREFDGLDNEYLLGGVANELKLSLKATEKLITNMKFMGLNTEEAAAKSGTRPSLTSEAPFTASNDVSRMRLMEDDADTTLATYIEEVEITINNNAYRKTAIGTLGAFDVGVGDFTVSGSVKAYFDSHAATNAIRNNTDVSLDFAVVQANAGWLFDLPLVVLGDGRKDVQKDEAVRLNLSAEAVAHATLNHTLLVQSFAYLPDLAE